MGDYGGVKSLIFKEVARIAVKLTDYFSSAPRHFVKN
jgi:hypothetical protein